MKTSLLTKLCSSVLVFVFITEQIAFSSSKNFRNEYHTLAPQSTMPSDWKTSKRIRPWLLSRFKSLTSDHKTWKALLKDPTFLGILNSELLRTFKPHQTPPRDFNFEVRSYRHMHTPEKSILHWIVYYLNYSFNNPIAPAFLFQLFLFIPLEIISFFVSVPNPWYYVPGLVVFLMYLTARLFKSSFFAWVHYSEEIMNRIITWSWFGDNRDPAFFALSLVHEYLHIIDKQIYFNDTQAFLFLAFIGFDLSSLHKSFPYAAELAHPRSSILAQPDTPLTEKLSRLEDEMKKDVQSILTYYFHPDRMTHLSQERGHNRKLREPYLPNEVLGLYLSEIYLQLREALQQEPELSDEAALYAEQFITRFYEDLREDLIRANIDNVKEPERKRAYQQTLTGQKRGTAAFPYLFLCSA
ncbi:MAG: hypothetical protein JW774_07685 [Candidatus Aureabacteria bacterium]|nr:hypothetical protein [Candidatus Auribacterota bacterium]